MDHDNQQSIALGVIAAFPALGGLAVTLRLWSRYLSRSSLGTDDYFICAGYVLAVGMSVTSWYYVKANYVGYHIWDIPKDYDVKKGLIWNFANQLLYNPALTMVKVSILLFLRRLESKSRLVNSLIWGTMAVTVGLFLAVLFVDLFQCWPVAYVYDKSIAHGKCIQQGAFYVATAALNLFTDLLVLSIPIIITWSLHMPLRRKLAVCLILCLGGVATAIGVWRIVILAAAFFPDPNHRNPDPTYSVGFCSSAVEVNVAVMSACAPSLKAIFSKYIPRLLGTSHGASNSKYYYGGASSSNRFRSGLGYPHRSVRAGDDDGFELADPFRANTADVKAEIRKYTRSGGRDGADSPSLSSEDGSAGIVKTMDVSVQYTTDQQSPNRTGSVDRLV
ncbi:succinate-semialdehyde dehydrogenase, mitochondrial [Aspergillus terreus]|uniref:Succinate-semialdehyde dehydrogenase, mitochondrial n=1 Tax=Aspergillus terreus TaxID=33178 RepID=A0A5M3YNY2_ASPTE|nr:hypothetical protein ATETN484_0001090800 [Aspergillus terreus]GFF12763.1 succinate-semialdehyde dehydrogenase, mitochondrial [Aspergillus terreus]